MDRGDEALPILQTALEQAAELEQAAPQDENVIFMSATINKDMAETMIRHFDVAGGDYQAALPFFDIAIEKLTRLVATTDNTKYETTLLRSHYLKSLTLYEIDEYTSALFHLTKAQDIGERRLLSDPDDAGMKRIIRNLRSQRANTLAYLEHFDEAISFSLANLQIVRKHIWLIQKIPGRRANMRAQYIYSQKFTASQKIKLMRANNMKHPCSNGISLRKNLASQIMTSQ